MNTPSVTDNWQAPAASAPSSGWAVLGKRWDTEGEQTVYQRIPVAPHYYTKELATIILMEMKRINYDWDWELIPPNVRMSDADTKP
jgi:hypothetical protein